MDIANVNRARSQKIRRVRGKAWWAKRRRKIVRRDNGKVVEFEEVKYGMLMMVGQNQKQAESLNSQTSI